MTPSQHPPFSVRTLAERWDCSERHIYNMIGDGRLASFKAGGRLVRIAAEEVARWESGGGDPIEGGGTGSGHLTERPSPSGPNAESAVDGVLASIRN